MKVLDTAAFKDYMREEVEKNGGVNEDLKDRIMGKLKVSAETIVFRLYICFFLKTLFIICILKHYVMFLLTEITLLLRHYRWQKV